MLLASSPGHLLTLHRPLATALMLSASWLLCGLAFSVLSFHPCSVWLPFVHALNGSLVGAVGPPHPCGFLSRSLSRLAPSSRLPHLSDAPPNPPSRSQAALLGGLGWWQALGVSLPVPHHCVTSCTLSFLCSRPFQCFCCRLQNTVPFPGKPPSPSPLPLRPSPRTLLPLLLQGPTRCPQCSQLDACVLF